MEEILENESISGIGKIKVKILDKIKKFILLEKEKIEVRKRSKGKIESVSKLLELINKTYLKKDIYLTPATQFLNKISNEEFNNIKEFLIKEFKEIDKVLVKEIEIVRFYLVKMNVDHLFDGYYKRLRFYNISKKISLKKEQELFYKNILNIIKEK